MTDVLVIGAGVTGLTTANCLAESGHSVRIRTAEPPLRSTSVVAGALIGGPAFGDREARWQQVSWGEFETLAGNPDTGVRMARGRLVSRLGEGTPPWAEALPGFQECAPDEHARFPVAFWVISPLADMPRYLAYLTGRYEEAGGEIVVRPVVSLAEAAAEAPVVVNCTGVGARALASDDDVHPIRGQHVVVENPGLDSFFFEGGADTDWVGFMPHAGRVVCGGNARVDDWSLAPDPQQTDEILRRCADVEPRLRGARVLDVQVGLRPGRSSVRLEEEPLAGARVIHSYGHGGAGVAMSWGCAREVADLIDRAATG